MIPRLGDGNADIKDDVPDALYCLENDSPSRGRKRDALKHPGQMLQPSV